MLFCIQNLDDRSINLRCFLTVKTFCYLILDIWTFLSSRDGRYNPGRTVHLCSMPRPTRRKVRGGLRLGGTEYGPCFPTLPVSKAPAVFWHPVNSLLYCRSQANNLYPLSNSFSHVPCELSSKVRCSLPLFAFFSSSSSVPISGQHSPLVQKLGQRFVSCIQIFHYCSKCCCFFDLKQSNLQNEESYYRIDEIFF